jgi:transposase
VRAALSAQRNKTDAADALGLAHIVRTVWYRQAHIKSEACHRLRLLLKHKDKVKGSGMALARRSCHRKGGGCGGAQIGGDHACDVG